MEVKEFVVKGGGGYQRHHGRPIFVRVWVCLSVGRRGERVGRG